MTMVNSYKKNLRVVFFAAGLLGSLIGMLLVTTAQFPTIGASSGGGSSNENLTNNTSTSPFRMGILAMPLMCTSPAEIAESAANMFGGNTTNQMMMMEMMKQQMMISGNISGTQNMTEQELQQAMQFAVCLPMDEQMLQNMTGS
jgi:hypothetical protein